MTTKLITYILIIASSFIAGLYVSNTDTEYINTVDTLKIETVVFETEIKTDTLVNVITKKDSIYFETIFNDTIYIQDTIRTVEFNLDDKFVSIFGKTYHRTVGNSSFDINYTLKPRFLTLKTYFTDNKVNNELYENGVKIPFKSKVEYKEYNKYIESLKTPTYLKWYVTIPTTILGMSGIIYLIK